MSSITPHGPFSEDRDLFLGRFQHHVRNRAHKKLCDRRVYFTASLFSSLKSLQTNPAPSIPPASTHSRSSQQDQTSSALFLPSNFLKCLCQGVRRRVSGVGVGAYIVPYHILKIDRPIVPLSLFLRSGSSHHSNHLSDRSSHRPIRTHTNRPISEERSSHRPIHIVTNRSISECRSSHRPIS